MSGDAPYTYKSDESRRTDYSDSDLGMACGISAPPESGNPAGDVVAVPRTKDNDLRLKMVSSRLGVISVPLELF